MKLYLDAIKIQVSFWSEHQFSTNFTPKIKKFSSNQFKSTTQLRIIRTILMLRFETWSFRDEDTFTSMNLQPLYVSMVTRLQDDYYPLTFSSLL